MASGTEPVYLTGPAMVSLVRAIAALREAELAHYVVVGGVAVIARLGEAHRATGDVDTVVDETEPPDAIEALLALPSASPHPDGAAHQVMVEETKVEVIGVGSLDYDALDGLTDRQRLFVAAHRWALDTATDLNVVAGADQSVAAQAPFATPAALVAMKLHAIQDRRVAGGQDKRASDADDVYRLLLRFDAEGSLRADLSTAPEVLRRAVRDALQLFFVDQAVRTSRWLASSAATPASPEVFTALARPVIEALNL